MRHPGLLKQNLANVTDPGPLSQAYVIPMLSVWGLSNAFLMGLRDFLGL